MEYQRAVALDSSYRTSTESAGLLCQSDGSFDKREPDLLRILTLDPDDPWALFGLGRIAARRKQWHEAERWLRQSLAIDDQFIDTHRALADVLRAQGHRREAVAAIERSLKLGLAGHKSLTGPIATVPDDECRLRDGEHCRAYARLGGLYASIGDISHAINAYRMSIAGGYGGAFIRMQLARLHGRRRQWRPAARETWSAIRTLPSELTRSGRRVMRLLSAVATRRLRSARQLISASAASRVRV